MRIKDLTGQRFGSFTVIEMSPRRSTAGQAYWLCECSCGRLVNVRGDSLRNGNSTQCSVCYNGCGRGSDYVFKNGGG